MDIKEEWMNLELQQRDRKNTKEPELKNTTDMKNTLEELKSSLENAKERINNMEDRVMESIQTE